MAYQVKVYGADPGFGLKTVHDLMAKLRWEIEGLENRNTFNAREGTYRAFNCAVTTWSVVDWIRNGLLPSEADAIGARLGISFASNDELYGYLFGACREIELCNRLANGSKHRKIWIENDLLIVGLVSAMPAAEAAQRDGKRMKEGMHHEPKIIDGRDRLRALDVFKMAESFLLGLIEAWKVDASH